MSFEPALADPESDPGATWALEPALVRRLARHVVTSKLGLVLMAIRDAESRVMFCGYNPLYYKLAVWTLSAVLCGIAGALYVPQVGIINPSEMSPANSIEIAIWTAVGGRGTLIGPIAGAFLVNGAKSWFTQAFPEFWLFFLGLLFVLVTLLLPDGVVGLGRRLARQRAAPCCPSPLRRRRPATSAARPRPPSTRPTGTSSTSRRSPSPSTGSGR